MSTQERGEVLNAHLQHDNALIGMLQYKRAAGSRTEKRFILEYLTPLGTQVDKKGNHYLRIGDAPIMWSSHTDSVHTAGGFQKIVKIGDNGFKIGLSKNESSNCLGADDAAGVWLMREMILAKIPGLYVFHRYEESGCHGSRWIVKNNPEMVKGMQFAVALDRRNHEDIITHQSGTRCCSDEFAASLAYQLEMGYKACSWGSFTDTAQYVDLIGECTNLSVGYTGAHTASEDLDVVHLLKLREKLINLKIDALVSKRKPGEKEPVKTYTYQGPFGRSYGGYYEGFDGESSYYGHNSGSEVYQQYSLMGNSKDWFPRRGSHGVWDASGEYFSWDQLPQEKAAMTAKEKRASYQKWWDKIFGHSKKHGATKPTRTYNGSNSTVARLHDQKSNGEGSNWWSRSGRNLPAVVGSNGHTVRTIRDDEGEVDEITSRPSMEKLVRNHPEAVASYLEDYGVSVDDLMMHILEVQGMLCWK